MGFLQPLALLGLVAAAVPPLLHLLGRRLPPTVVFPAIRYLTATEREHSRRLKLRNLLLMVLRVAVIALLVLAAARPVARMGAGGHTPTAVGFVVDNSLSSGAVVGGRRALDVMVGRVRAAVADLGAEDAVWATFADGVPRRMGRDEFMTLLDTLAPVAVRLDVGAALRALDQVLVTSADRERVIALASDLQRTALSAGTPLRTRVIVWAPGSPPRNRGLDSAFAEPAVWVRGGQLVAVVSGDEAGDAPAALRAVAGERDLARAVVRPGDRVVLDVSLSTPGWRAIRLELDADELRADDRYHVAAYVAAPAAVASEPSAGRFVADAVEVLRAGGRVRQAGAGPPVTIGDRVGSGIRVVLPPAQPALVGALNRDLASRGVAWRLAELRSGEWVIDGGVLPGAGAAVYRRYALSGSGDVLLTVGGEPWVVRDRGVVILGSRLEDDWTALPVSAAFVPFLDALVNGATARSVAVVWSAPGATVVLAQSVESVLTPDGPAPVPADRRFAAPSAPGVYFLRGAARDTVGALVVNHDARESRLEPADLPSLRASLGARVDLIRDGEFADALRAGGGRTELTALLLALALAAAISELLLGTAGTRTTES